MNIQTCESVVVCASIATPCYVILRAGRQLPGGWSFLIASLVACGKSEWFGHRSVIGPPCGPFSSKGCRSFPAVRLLSHWSFLFRSSPAPELVMLRFPLVSVVLPPVFPWCHVAGQVSPLGDSGAAIKSDVVPVAYLLVAVKGLQFHLNWKRNPNRFAINDQAQRSF
jgi:hypothetical protein